MQSNTIAELAAAMSKAQGEMQDAEKDSQNPFFKSHYSSLESCWKALRPVLVKHQLAITQTTEVADGQLMLRTCLMHSSGEWIDGLYPITAVDNKPQSLGSAMSYGKRYSLQAITGLASSDDDGNAANGHRDTVGAGHQTNATLIKAQPTSTAKETYTTTPVWYPTQPQLKRLFAIAKENNWDHNDIKAYLQKLGIEATEKLTGLQYEAMIKNMQALPKGDSYEDSP